jgi:hypothetical protein
MAKTKKSAALRALERAAGGPLTFGRMLQAIRLGEDMTLEVFARSSPTSSASTSAKIFAARPRSAHEAQQVHVARGAVRLARPEREQCSTHARAGR